MKGLTLQFGFGKLFLLLGLVAMDKSHATLRVVYQTSTSCLIQEGAVYYNYQGTSPRRDIQLALNESDSEDDILVCAGTYTEALSVPPRTLTLRGEQNPNDPASANITLLTKNNQDVSIITANGGPGEPVLTLRFLKLAGGVLPAGGNGAGAAISGVPWKLELDHCLLENNQAPHGGAIFLSSPLLIISNTVFRNNSTTSNQAVGGAINLIGGMQITDSRFEGNSSHNGGAIGYFPKTCAVTSIIEGTVFEGNHATSSSGAIDYSGHGLQCEIPLTISNSEFNNNWVEMNSAGAIGMIGGRAEITGTGFYSNSAPGSGGAIVSGSSVLTLTGCYFSFSTTSNRGGAILSGGSTSTSLSINSSNFAYNTSVTGGGAVSVEEGQLSISETNFESNGTCEHGAALKVEAAGTTIERSSFFNNRQGNDYPCVGNAIIDINAPGAQIRNSLVYGNISQSSAILGAVGIENSTIYNNVPVAGGVEPYYQVDFGNSTTGTFANSIVWHHDSYNGQVNSIRSLGSVLATHSFVKGGFPGTQIYDVPPLVYQDDPANAHYYDFRLRSNSPAINKGDNGYVQPAEKDLDGNPRIFGNPATDKVDVGAYEFQGVATSTVTITSNEQQGLVQPISNGTVQVQNGSDLTVKIFTGARFGKSATFRGITYNHDFRPYRISQVLLDGVPVTLSPTGSNGQQFTISNINEPHAVVVEYETVTFDVVVNTTGGGKVSPDGTVKVLYGNDQTIQVRRSPGVAVTKITVDGEEISTGDLSSYRFSNVRENHAITFDFTSCNIQNNINPSYVEERAYETEGQFQTSFTVKDGFGKDLQNQLKLNNKVRTNLVKGVYTDGLGRELIAPLRFTHTEPVKDFQFINMGCLELVARANQYYAPGNPEPGVPDAEDFAFYEKEYHEDPESGLKRGGEPGPVYTLRNTEYHGSRAWSFGVENDDDFLASSQLSVAQLDEKFASKDAHAENSRYHLAVGRTPDGNFTQSISDNFGNILRTWANPDNSDDAKAIVVTNEVNMAGKIVSTTLPDASQIRELEYDKIGNVIAATSPDNGLVESKFDKLGRLRFTKTAMQRQEDIGSSIDHFTVTNYDDQDRKLGVYLNNGTTGKFSDPDADIPESEMILMEKYYYDNLVQADLEDVGLSTPMATKILSELHIPKNSLAMTVSYFPSFDETNAVRKIAIITSSYRNNLNESDYQVIPGLPVQKMTSIYDSRDNQIGRIYYDGLDENENWRQVSKKEDVFDINGRLVGYKFDDQQLIEYSYNDLGHMYSKNYFNRNSNLVETVEYQADINGRPTKISTLGPDPLFSQIMTYHDPSVKPGAGTERYGGKLQSLTLSYDNNGERADETKVLHYDDNSRLSAVEKNQDASHSVYALDKMGRFTRKKEGGIDLDEFTYKDGNNQLTHIAGASGYEHPGDVNNFAYDLNGNLVLDRSKKMTIDYNYRGLPVTFNFYQSMPAGNLDWQDVKSNALGSQYTRIGFVKMAYDVDGDRVLKVAKIGNEEKSIAYVGNTAIFEGSSFDNLALKYVNITTVGGVTGKRVVGTGGADYFYIKDHLQSVRAVVKEDGSVAEENDFAAYGDMFNLQPSSEPVRENWTGKELDREGPDNGIVAYYFGARYYDPVAGLWLTVDPVSQTYSPYTFGGDPLNSTDPAGEEIAAGTVVAIIAVSAVIGGTLAAVNSSIFSDAKGKEFGKEVAKGAIVGAVSAAVGLCLGPNPWASGYMSSMAWGAVTGTVTSAATLAVDLAITASWWPKRTDNSPERIARELGIGALMGGIGGGYRHWKELRDGIETFVDASSDNYLKNYNKKQETSVVLQRTKRGMRILSKDGKPGELHVDHHEAVTDPRSILMNHNHPLVGDVKKDVDIFSRATDQDVAAEQLKQGGLDMDLMAGHQNGGDQQVAAYKGAVDRVKNQNVNVGEASKPTSVDKYVARQPKPSPIHVDMVPAAKWEDGTMIQHAAVISTFRLRTGGWTTPTLTVTNILPISDKSRLIKEIHKMLWYK